MQAGKITLFELLKDQLLFDKFIDKFDRNLFYLPSRVEYDVYLKGLTGLIYKEIDGKAVEFNYSFNWTYFIPEIYLQFNPLIHSQLEKSVKLRSDFINGRMLKQTLVFNDPISADIIFQVFSRNSKWDKIVGPNTLQACRSLDEKYTVMMMSHESEYSFLNSTSHIILVYK